MVLSTNLILESAGLNHVVRLLAQWLKQIQRNENDIFRVDVSSNISPSHFISYQKRCVKDILRRLVI